MQVSDVIHVEIQMIPKFSYRMQSIYKMHQAGEKLSEMLLTLATNLGWHVLLAPTSVCCSCNLAPAACVWWNSTGAFVQVAIILSSDSSVIIYQFWHGMELCFPKDFPNKL